MPEERNRIEVDRIAALLLCPDERSRETLAAEGVPGGIEVVGDVMADAARLFAPLAASARVDRPASPAATCVATVHREANVVQPRLGRIVEGLNRLEEPIVFPAAPAHARRARARRASSSARMSRCSSRSATSSSPPSPRRRA